MDQMKASNATFLDDNTGGKGKYFRARILQAGLVKYSFGVCLLEKDTIDKFIYGFVGCPVIIDHKDITNENAKDERVGVISKVWFNETDGWFWVEGVIFDEKAISLINDGYNVSCQYEISEYANNVGKKLHNGNPFDKVILNGKPEHLAIVKNPRYENAMIAVNALEIAQNKEWDESKCNRDEEGKFANKYSIEDVVEGNENKLKLKKDNKDIGYLSYLEKEDDNNLISIDYMLKTDESEHGVAEKLVKHLFEKFPNKNFEWHCVTEDSEKARKRFINKYPDLEGRISGLWYDEVQKQFEKDEGYVPKNAINTIIQAINEIKETDMFSKLFKKKENKMDKDELKSLFMECLSELTAKNEAGEKKEDDKLADDKVADNEDDKDNEKKDEEKADNKCKNEVVDKRDIIRQIMAIAGKEEASEDVKEIAKLAEKLAYDKSEADKKADNKCKNEDDKDDDKKEEKEDEKEKASNSLDDIIGKMSAGTFERKSEGYMTQKKAVELGDKLF